MKQAQAGTKGRKVEGAAKVERIGFWMPLTGPQWENPSIDFMVDGERFTWNASGEYAVRGLRVGGEVKLKAFARANGMLYRVSFTELGRVEDAK